MNRREVDTRMDVFTTRRFEFSAAHRYWNPKWSEEQNLAVFGKCTNLHGHGHNYVLEVTVAGQVDDATGMVISMTDLTELVGKVLEPFDHAHLNEDLPYFHTMQPTTENIVQVLWSLIAPHMPTVVRLHRLRLYETPSIWAEFYGGPSATFSRAYSFSAAHRLEVTVEEIVDPETGMVMNLVDLDRAVQPLLDEWDHRSLDRQPVFRNRPATGEQIVHEIWKYLQGTLGKRLRWLTLWETPATCYEYGVQEP